MKSERIKPCGCELVYDSDGLKGDFPEIKYCAVHRHITLSRNQLRDEYKERVRREVDGYIRSQGVHPDQIDAYIGRLDLPTLRKFAKVVYLQLQQLAQIVKETK